MNVFDSLKAGVNSVGDAVSNVPGVGMVTDGVGSVTGGLTATMSVLGTEDNKPKIDAATNKATAFSESERKELGIVGFLPQNVESLEVQLDRLKFEFDDCPRPIDRYALLSHVEDTNLVLFYAFVDRHLSEVLPVIYTPTVGQACQEFSRRYRPSRGIYLSKQQRGNFVNILQNHQKEIDIIVVTDGGRILGLGDLGVGGMGIPLGKLSLYVASAGFDPSRTLPVVLDVGTNNQSLLDDPLYIGQKHERVSEEEFFPLVAEFVDAVNTVWPKSLIQFEDFATPNAIALLEKHRESTLCFNDDIQGTGSTVLAGLMTALNAQGTDPKDMKCVVYGAGSASVGTVLMIVSWLQTLGMSRDDALGRFWMLDSKGLITADRHDADRLPSHKLPFKRNDKHIPDLLSTIAEVKPHVMMGMAANGPDFKEEHIKEMISHVERPIVFALSNPTPKAEITAKDAYEWTEGKVIYGSGSPFPDVVVNGNTVTPSQANNMFIFPGIGFGAVLAQSKKVTDTMFIAGAKALAEMVPEEDTANGVIFPRISQLREVAIHVAVATMEQVYEEKLERVSRPSGDLAEFVRSQMWVPKY